MRFLAALFLVVPALTSPNRNDRLRPNNGMQRTALRAAADAER
jgi:hypothetical protein